MKGEPDIVKQLRNEEKQGILGKKSETEYLNSSNKKTTGFLKENESDSEILKLKKIENRYKEIFENYFVGITIADKNEKIISWNKYAEKLLKMGEEDLFLRNVNSLYPPDEWDRIRAENIRQKGMKYKMETKMIDKNGRIFDVEISICILKGAKGKTIGSIGIIHDITTKKKIKEKLVLNQNLLESIIENIPDSIYFKDKKGRYIKVNREKASKLNKNPEEIIGKTDYDIYPKEKAEINTKDDKKVLKKGDSIIGKIHCMTDYQGKKHWISVTKVPRYNKKNEIIGLIGIDREITDIKESEEKYKNLFETAIDPILLLDKEGKFIEINNQVTETLGYHKKDLLGKKFYEEEILDKKSKEKAIHNFKQRLKDKNIKPYEVTVITKDGKLIPGEINASTLKRQGEIIGVVVIIRDLSERQRNRQIERELTESEKKFREIFDATSDFLIYLEKDIILDINNAASKTLELKKENVIGKKISFLKNKFTEEGIKKHMEAINKAINGEVINEYKTVIKSKKDVIYEYLFSVDSVRYNEKIKGIIIRGRDITQRQHAWNELVRLEEKYRILAETSADGVITIDPLGRLTYINPSFEKMIKRRKGKILATLFRNFLSEDSVYFFQQLMVDARKKRKKIENVELEIVLPDGETIPIEMNISPVEKNGKFSGMVCTIRDITERRRVEAELKKSERLKTEFMNIAAHELKSPVTPIKGYLDLIISDEKTSNQIKDWAKVSLRNAERLLRIVNDILDVSRLDTDTMRFDMEKINPHDILDEIIEDMKPVIKNKGLRFIIEIQKELPNIMGDRYRLSQVFKNLLVNALKFTDKGYISIKAKKEEKNIHIKVEDTGIGISKDEEKKVFNKFYQAYTGEDRKNEGTGLGLFICKEIIKKHKGYIWVESKIGKGSVFHINLPYIHKMVLDRKK